ncbi:MAG: HEAT repeat domain-containing protein [Spirochaetia bacterium]|nr:HEAT repeat domain-containing protein [Spirochaetia bacterium]
MRINIPKDNWFRFFYFVLFFLILNACLFPETPTSESPPVTILPKYSAKTQADAIWNLNYTLASSRDDSIIILLEKIDTMPEDLWRRVLTVAIEDQRTVLRNYLLRRFLDKFPFNEENMNVYHAFVGLLEFEYNRFIKKTIPEDSDQEEMILVLQVVAKWKIKEMLYQTSALLAYPLMNIRKAANETIAVIQDDRIYPVILNLSKSENPVERTYAIDSLYYIKDERTIPVLLQLLNDRNKSVRYYAIRSLDNMNAQDAIPYYIRVLRSDVNDEVRMIAAKVLARIKPPMAFNSLLDTLSDANPLVRKSVLEALNEYAYQNAAFVISRQLSQETENELKLMEIQSLLALSSSGMMAGLNRIMKDEKDTSILLWSIYVTGKLGDYNGYELLLANLSHTEARVRQESAIALSNFKVKRTVPYLLEILSNEKESYPVQTAALYSLKSIDDNSAIAKLYNLSFTHSNLMIRAEIRDTMKNLLEKRFK